MADGVEQNAQSRSHRLGLGNTDEKWPEVMFINDYAVFMGYLSMAVTGTGILVFTWSTVVLLGGFVTMLPKKDFWSLTVITLVQTRIFDVFLNGNISYFGYSLKRLWKAALSIALPRAPFQKWSARGLIRVLVFTIVLCPLFALYMFGLFVSPWISLWRLLQQDFGDDTAGGDNSKANLKPALVVLYSLGLFQGVLFCYRAISSLEEQRLLKLVAQAYSLQEDDAARESLSDYLREIRVGCEKDPSFARGRNLITYAAELMQSNSPDNYVSGVRILDTLILSKDSRRMLIMNNMIGSASSGAIDKLVQMLDSGSRYDGSEIRLRAMRIVAHFASQIRLNKVPYGIQCIQSFLEHSEACQYKHTSIDILLTLTNDKENLRLMRNTSGLALKVIRLLAKSDDQLHDSEHDRWCSSVALPGMEVIKRFMSSSNNMQLPRDTLESTEAVGTLEDMLDCERCKVQEKVQISAVVVLTQIISSMDSASLPVGDQGRERLIQSLIGTFLDGSDNSSSLKKLAGESLLQLSITSEKSAALILGAKTANGDDIVENLTKVLLDANSRYRKSAADILKHLCGHDSTNDKHSFEKLKSAMVQVIPKVLREVLGCSRSAIEEPRQPSEVWCASSTAYSAYQYMPMSCYVYPSHYTLLDNSYDVEVQEALSSLCATVHGRLISVDPDLAPRFDDIIAAEISKDMAKEPAMSFAGLVKEAAQVVADKRRSWIIHPVICSEEENPNSCCIS